VDYKYFQKLEGQNPSSPTLSTLNKLAKGLGLSLPELIANIDADHRERNSTS
jgi:transcriptional regulator with XRE-family HTH domain